MMRLLLVEDDRKIAFFVKTGLQEAGFSVTHITVDPPSAA
jgi:DNA-binding response OmpR family regulator